MILCEYNYLFLFRLGQKMEKIRIDEHLCYEKQLLKIGLGEKTRNPNILSAL